MILSAFLYATFAELMWEPVLQDKRLEHVKFCRYAVQLIEQVSGKPSRGTEDPSLDRMRRVGSPGWPGRVLIVFERADRYSRVSLVAGGHRGQDEHHLQQQGAPPTNP